MSKKYKEFSGLNLPNIEKEILASWEQHDAFQKSVAIREGATPFVFYEGPPSANGMPGIHHVISRTLKDLVCRYKTMQGFQVKRKGGWDTHGLPVELGVEKELGITKEDIGKKITVEEYNQKCREAVLRYKNEWDSITKKMGYWVDLNEPYVTFENNYIESLWWLLKKMYDRGLLYESVSIQPYSPAAGTGLSSHELNQPGTYKDVKDTSATAMFKVCLPNPSEGGAQQPAKILELLKIAEEAWKDSSVNPPSEGREAVFFLAWTTTPWTLPSNLGLTVGATIDYTLIKTFNPYTHVPANVVIAKNLIGKYFKAEAENGDFDAYSAEVKATPWTIIAEFKGAAIEGARYEQLLPFEANTPEVAGGDPFRVLCDSFVTTEDGTGIVHTAPAFGADDYKVGKKYGIGILTMVDRRGKFLSGIQDGIFLYGDEYVKEDYFTEAEKEAAFQHQKQILEAHGKVKDLKKYMSVDDRIVLKLQEENRLFKKEKYDHTYPHCWRTDKPILYYPLDAWFIKTTALKDRMVELNKTINWKPKSTGEGRFGNWLENMVDWNLSRSRYWGTPLPVWRTEDGTEQVCIGSIQELNDGIRKASEVLGGDVNKHYLHQGILDLHKPYVDDIILVSPTGQPMKRVADLIDVWFDSGAMPYAQWHFPFENKEIFSNSYPADFIAEGVDQTRGWFYTLHAIGSLIKEDIEEELKKAGLPTDKIDGRAYKTVVSNGLVLDKNGNKMSKRLGNVVNPFETIEKYGADATRWYLITNASPWDNLKFDLAGIQEVQRKFFGTLYNTYQFFALYANVDGFNFTEAYIPLAERPEIDRWILSSLNTLKAKCTTAMDDYEPTIAGRLIEEFVDEHLSNWYVRLCRRRFWKGDYEQDKICAYQTLYECLETIVRLIAPISPFFSDVVFNNLNEITGRFTETSVHHVAYPKADTSFIDSSLEERMQLAQDASSLVLSLRKKVNIKVRQPLQKVLIPVMDPAMKLQLEKIEDLIKAEVNVKEISYITETEGFIKKKIKPNFKLLGAKLGGQMKEAAGIITEFSQHQISALEKDAVIEITLSSGIFELSATDVDIIAEDIPGWSVASKGALTVALDISLTEELKKEGDARELINRVQNIRKESGFDVTDRIFVQLFGGESIKQSIIDYNDYICREILAESIVWVSELANGTEIEINEVQLKVDVSKKA
jgi:isoleucyl-tRNA synthetase